MLGLLRRMWGAAEKPLHAEPAIATIATATPRPAAAVATLAPGDFMRRETLIDRAERIAGYEFSLFSGLQQRLKSRGGSARRAFDAALLTRLTLQGGSSLLGQRLAFVHLAADSLQEPLLDVLPAQNTVLMLDVAQPESDWTLLATQATALVARGFFLGVQVPDASALACPLLALADFIAVNVAGFDGLELREMVARLRQQRSLRRERPRLLARNLQSHDEFLFSEKCGFDYFHGPFVSGPGALKTPERGGINRMVVLPILNMVRADASFGAIADQLKSEPTLSYKLLRYLNSPAMGLQVRVESLSEALALIGREKFYRWMSLLLFDFGNPSYRERSLSERALTRGRTLELLSGQGAVPGAPDQLFLIGLFSLLDLALQLPMAELLEQAALPEPVSQALLGRPGPLFDALQMVALGEADTPADPDQWAEALLRCGVDDAPYGMAATQALVWAHAALGATE
jgi:EAL and modified HD-GYP domain-containing signal transduction protein